MKKYNQELKYGVIIGLLVSAYVFLEYLLGFHTTNFQVGQYSGYISIIIPIIATYHFFKEKLKTEKKLEWKPSLKSGFLIYTTAAIILGVFFWVYLTAINPSFAELGLEFQEQKLLDAGVPQEQIDSEIEAQKAIFTPGIQASAAFFGTILQGLLITIIIVAIVKRKAKKK